MKRSRIWGDVRGPCADAVVGSGGGGTTDLTRAEMNGRAPHRARDRVGVAQLDGGWGLGSLVASLGVIVHFLATHPVVQSALRADRSSLPAAIDEMLRIGKPFLVNRRVTNKDTAIRGHAIEAGTRI